MILKNKKSTRSRILSSYEHLLKCTRSQEGVFGLSFGMIFTIILIIFFIAVAAIAIKAFLGYQKCTQVGLFYQDFQTDVTEAFYSGGSSFNKTYFIPTGIDYVCLINLSSAPKSMNSQEAMIYQSIKEGNYMNADNFYTYSSENNNPCAKLEHTLIKFVDLSGRNPICIRVAKNKVTINIQKQFEYPAVKVFE